MLADDAAGVLAGSSGLGAKAGSVRGEADGQSRVFQNLVAIEICDRDLRCGNQPVVAVAELAAGGGFGVSVGAAKEIFGELGKLAGSEEAPGVDHEGRQHLSVAVLLSVYVEHEADEGALETGSGADVDSKPCAAELGRALEVENAKFFAEFPMGLGGEVELPLLAPGLDGDVVSFGFATGNFVTGEVGDAGE